MVSHRSFIDPNLNTITQSILSHVSVQSIILAGSRATEQGMVEGSDYDIVVLMGLFQIPFHLGKLRKLERELREKLGTGITISPLPTFRARKAKGNLFLFKLKREGVLLFGKDWLTRLDPGEISDIEAERYFSYLFSGMKLLVHHFEPELLAAKLKEEESQRISLDAAKAILYCGEIYSLLNGFYETVPEKMVSRLSEVNISFPVREGLISDLQLSSRVRKGLITAEDPIELWFRTKKHLYQTFKLLTNTFIDSNAGTLDALIEKYLENRRGFSMKNLQYAALTTIGRKELWWRALTTRYRVEDRLRLGLLCLLTSVGEDGRIEEEAIERANLYLRGYTHINHPTRDTLLWHAVRDTIETYWPYACVLMGL